MRFAFLQYFIRSVLARGDLSINTGWRKEGRVPVSGAFLPTRLPERRLYIFCRSAFHSTEDYISASYKESQTIYGVTRWRVQAYSLSESPLSSIPALNKQISDGSIHWGGFRSPTTATVCQLRQRWQTESHRTHSCLKSSSLYNLAMILILRSTVCVCLHGCACVCVYAYMYVCTHTWVCIYEYVCVHECYVYVCMCMHRRVYEYVCVFVYVCACVHSSEIHCFKESEINPSI